jgi:hypothetical protein
VLALKHEMKNSTKILPTRRAITVATSVIRLSNF